MIRTLGLIAFAVLFATSASAAVTTIEYTLGDGQTVTIAYDDATSTATNTADGSASPYKWDEATNTVCSSDPEGKEVCATFESAGTEAGHETAFSTNDGQSGTAKIISVQ